MKALHSFEKYRQLSEDFDQLKADASLQLTRVYMKLAERRTDHGSLQYMIKAYEASTQSRSPLKFERRLHCCFSVQVEIRKWRTKQVTNWGKPFRNMMMSIPLWNTYTSTTTIVSKWMTMKDSVKPVKHWLSVIKSSLRILSVSISLIILASSF